MENDYSKNALMQFLDYIVDKGLINAKTGKAWRIAASKLLTDLSASEEGDVRTVDVDIAARKMANRNPGALSPNSLNDYRQRLAISIQEFVSWTNDPAAYKPRGHNGKVRTKPSENGTAGQERKATTSKKATSEATAKEVPVTSGGLPFAYPLRPDFLAQVVIPRDLKVEEARRLGAFLLTIASDFSPEQS